MELSIVRELEEKIKKYATEYYSGQSSVSDEYFDGLVDELRKVCPDSPVLKTAWGYDPKEKCTHLYGLHIGSLSKIKESDNVNLSDYLNNVTRVSAKLDGLSVVSYYKDGQLVKSITRGNGYEGEDVTDKIKMIAPEANNLVDADGQPFSGAIRGEVVMPQSTFDEEFSAQKEENPSINPRNIASGLINRGSITQKEADLLHYVLYKVLHSESFIYESLSEIERFFKVHNPDVRYVDYRYDVVPSHETLKELRDEFAEMYPCDGLVLTQPDLEVTGSQGEYSEIAYKFQAESTTVTVTEVTYHATRTGRMAPIIWFEPTELSGAMCQKCTGFNAAFIRDNQLGPGAQIEVCRSGEVIPHVLKVITPSDNVQVPSVCPNCGEELIWSLSNEDLICINENESQLAYHYITTIAPEDGAGYSLYSQIVTDLGLDSQDKLVDFLKRLNEDNGVEPIIQQLESVGNISGTVTWSKVDKILFKLRRPVDSIRFLCACSIKGLGWNTAKSILQEYPQLIEDIRTESLNEEKLYKVKGVGYRTVQNLVMFSKRIAMIADVVPVEIYQPEEVSETLFKVAITGKLSMKRDDFVNLLKSKGIEVSGINKDTKYLITDNPNSGSSKNKLADKFGVTKITEEEFTEKYLKE